MSQKKNLIKQGCNSNANRAIKEWSYFGKRGKKCLLYRKKKFKKKIYDRKNDKKRVFEACSRSHQEYKLRVKFIFYPFKSFSNKKKNKNNGVKK